MEAISSINNKQFDPGFMDSMALEGIMHSKTMSHAEKVEAATTQFEAIFIKEFISKGFKPMFGEDKNSGGGLGVKHGGYEEIFLPEIISQRLATQGVFGLNQVFVNNIEQN